MRLELWFRLCDIRIGFALMKSGSFVYDEQQGTFCNVVSFPVTSDDLGFVMAFGWMVDRVVAGDLLPNLAVVP